MKRNMTKSGKIAYGAMLVALAMIFSYVESLIPITIGIPGIKLGVANLVTVLGIFFLRPCEVLTVVIMRIFLVGLYVWKWCFHHIQSGRWSAESYGNANYKENKQIFDGQC